MSDTIDAPRCAVCDKPLDADTAHSCHRSDCPVPVLAYGEREPSEAEARQALRRCDCDVLVHPECCPDCAEPGQ